MATYRVSEDLLVISVRSEEQEQERFVELVHAWISEFVNADDIDAINAALAEAYWFTR